jgi:hypothetical protein
MTVGLFHHDPDRFCGLTRCHLVEIRWNNPSYIVVDPFNPRTLVVERNRTDVATIFEQNGIRYWQRMQ